MWCIKLFATFATTAKRDAAVAFIEARLAPGTGSLAPADSEVKVADPSPSVDLSISFIYSAAPARVNLQNLWSQRSTMFDTRVTGSRAGMVSGRLVIVEYDNTSQPLIMRWMCTLEQGGTLTDCRDDDVPATQNDVERLLYYPGSK